MQRSSNSSCSEWESKKENEKNKRRNFSREASDCSLSSTWMQVSVFSAATKNTKQESEKEEI